MIARSVVVAVAVSAASVAVEVAAEVGEAAVAVCEVAAMAVVRADGVAAVVGWECERVRGPAVSLVAEVAEVQVRGAPTEAARGCRAEGSERRAVGEAGVECRMTAEEAAWTGEAEAEAAALKRCSVVGRCRSVWAWRRVETEVTLACLHASMGRRADQDERGEAEVDEAGTGEAKGWHAEWLT